MADLNMGCRLTLQLALSGLVGRFGPLNGAFTLVKKTIKSVPAEKHEDFVPLNVHDFEFILL